MRLSIIVSWPVMVAPRRRKRRRYAVHSIISRNDLNPEQEDTAVTKECAGRMYLEKRYIACMCVYCTYVSA